MMGWAFNGNKKDQEENEKQETSEDPEKDDSAGQNYDENEVQGINLGETTEIPKKGEPFSREMYEELE